MRQSRDHEGGATARRLGDPWRELADASRGYLSVYFSEPLAQWPVREITRPAEDKSDPNIETGTYGLFSTCELSKRNRIVLYGEATIFFLTTRKPHQGRLISRYYHADWYTEGTHGAVNRDDALASDKMPFIDPILARDLADPLTAIRSTQARSMKPIDVETLAALRRPCDERPGRTAKYLGEVERAEAFTRARSGYAYPSWGREAGFSWTDASDYYQTHAELSKVPNSSKNRKWRRGECCNVIKSDSLLKECPLCKQIATLAPADEGS